MKTNPVYILGSIFRVIYRNVAIPENIMQIIFPAPASGLALATKSHHATQADQEELARLMANIDNLPARIPVEERGQFWLGYYHYLSACDHAREFGPDQLTKVGKVLFGETWQTELARALDLSRSRRVRAWLSGSRKIPVGIWADIGAIVREKKMSLNQVLKDLRRLGLKVEANPRHAKH